MELDEKLFNHRVMLRVKNDAADFLGETKGILMRLDKPNASQILASGEFERALETFILRVREAEAAVLATP